MFPDDLTIASLSASMRGLSLRNQVLANNLANSDTPGYKRLDVSFNDQLAQAIQQDQGGTGDVTTMDTQATDAVGGVIAEGQGGVVRVDGSTVNPDTEMADLAANQLDYRTVTQLLTKKFGQLIYVINGH